jgi:hypothetical protein
VDIREVCPVPSEPPRDGDGEEGLCPFLMLPSDAIRLIGFFAADPLLEGLFALAGTCRAAHAAIFRSDGIADPTRKGATGTVWPVPDDLACANASRAARSFGRKTYRPCSMKKVLLGHELLSLPRRAATNSLLHPSAWPADLQRLIHIPSRRSKDVPDTAVLPVLPSTVSCDACTLPVCACVAVTCNGHAGVTKNDLVLCNLCAGYNIDTARSKLAPALRDQKMDLTKSWKSFICRAGEHPCDHAQVLCLEHVRTSGCCGTGRDTSICQSCQDTSDFPTEVDDYDELFTLCGRCSQTMCEPCFDNLPFELFPAFCAKCSLLADGCRSKQCQDEFPCMCNSCYDIYCSECEFEIIYCDGCFGESYCGDCIDNFEACCDECDGFFCTVDCYIAHDCDG